jgi:hypothetical protein
MSIKNGDLPAMPVMDESTQEQYNGVLNTRHSVLSYGLTKREQFAMAAMQGYCADGGLDYCFKTIAESAVGVADALLAELERSK